MLHNGFLQKFSRKLHRPYFTAKHILVSQNAVSLRGVFGTISNI